MEIIKYPEYTEWKNISKRATMDVSTLFDTVRQVLDDVRINGDAAIRKYEKQFDKVDLTDLLVSEDEIAEAESLVSEDLKQAIRTAKENIETFHVPNALKEKNPDRSGSCLLAKSCSNRKGWFIRSRWNGSVVFYRIDAGSSGSDCRL